jgi:uncharacterized coiled-coil protein SlyX|tara:strand:- start:188 stop:385 length:198 start_codon:yes stop_codon:yes gene_type:complete
MKAQKVIDKLESKLDNIEKLVDEISLLCMDARQQIDKFNENEHIEDFPELDEFNNEEDIDEEEDK